MRPIQATISHSALAHNLAVAKKHAPESKIMAVVKANAYGHGLIDAAHGLNAADGFAVLRLSEAIDLREAGFSQTILLLEGVFQAQELQIAASFGVDMVVHCAPQIEMLERIKLARPISVHLKMNSGMNRLGIPASPVSYTHLDVYKRQALWCCFLFGWQMKWCCALAWFRNGAVLACFC